MSGFTDLLRKLGIFRSGKTAAKYTNAKERPLELQQDDVFNEQKDVINPPAEKPDEQNN